MSGTVTREDLSKALSALRDLAKGGTTPATKEESMTGESGDTHAAKYSGGGNSPTSWAGSTMTSVPENGATDSIEGNGSEITRVRKSIMDKISKGQKLSPEEMEIAQKALFGQDDDDGKKVAKGADHPDEEQDKKLINQMMGKSLADHARTSPEVRSGLEVSKFLAAYADVMDKSMTSSELRIKNAIEQRFSSQERFNKSLAEAVAKLATVLGAQGDRIESVSAQPARPPRSVQAAPIEKSFAGSSDPAEMGLSKSLVLSAMTDMAEKGRLDPKEVIKYESTGQIRAAVLEDVRAHLGRH